MDAADRREATLSASGSPQEWLESGRFDRYVEGHNVNNPDMPIATKSWTIPLWLEEQYQHDLADWERKSRHHLMQGCTTGGTHD